MIPLVNLARQHASLRPQIEAAIGAVLDSGALIGGPFVERFEAEFADFCGTAHAVGTASGTAALHLALRACGIGPGDEVITTPATFVATVAAIRYAGATPVLVDTLPDIPLIDPKAVERAVTPRTRAIMPVHLYGHPCDMDALAAIARTHRLKLIEDASQAHGAFYKDHRVGSLGDVGCFSLYPGKNLGALGDAGIVITNDPDLAASARSLRNWAIRPDRLHGEGAFNYRLDALQAAVLSVKLPYLDLWSAQRRANAGYYDARLGDLGLSLLKAPADCQSVHHVYPIRHPGRDALLDGLAKAGVQAGVHYQAPVHLQPGYPGLGGESAFPNAEAQFRDTLSLPVCPELKASEQAVVIEAVTRLVEQLAAGRRAA